MKLFSCFATRHAVPRLRLASPGLMELDIRGSVAFKQSNWEGGHASNCCRLIVGCHYNVWLWCLVPSRDDARFQRSVRSRVYHPWWNHINSSINNYNAIHSKRGALALLLRPLFSSVQTPHCKQSPLSACNKPSIISISPSFCSFLRQAEKINKYCRLIFMQSVTRNSNKLQLVCIFLFSFRFATWNQPFHDSIFEFGKTHSSQSVSR